MSGVASVGLELGSCRKRLYMWKMPFALRSINYSRMDCFGCWSDDDDDDDDDS